MATQSTITTSRHRRTVSEVTQATFIKYSMYKGRYEQMDIQISTKPVIIFKQLIAWSKLLS